MLLKCAKCGNDNQLGAIFCRECGEKLEIETIRPNVEKTKATNIIGIVRRVVTGIILLILIYVIAAMFIPQSPPSSMLASDLQAKASEKFKAMMAKIDGRYGESSYVFTPAEVTYLYNNEMTEEAAAETGSYSIEKMYFTIDSRSFVHIMIQSKLAGKVPVTFALTGILPEDSTAMTVRSTQMGRLGLPKMFKKKIISKFTSANDTGIIKKLIDGSASVKVENGDFVITLKKEE